MKHLKKGDTILLRLGNSCIPSFIVYNERRFLGDNIAVYVAYKSNKIWRIADGIT